MEKPGGQEKSSAPAGGFWSKLRAPDLARWGGFLALLAILVALLGHLFTLQGQWSQAANRANIAERQVVELERKVSELQLANTKLQVETENLKGAKATLVEQERKASELQLANTKLQVEAENLKAANAALDGKVVELRTKISELEYDITKLRAALRPGEEPASTSGPSALSGKEVPRSVRRFPVDTHYVASGKMGDIEDVTIAGQSFIYKTAGNGPHEYEWKYENDGRTLSSRPAQFGGVVWLSPANAFGTDLDGGYDLRSFRAIEWEARSVGEPVNVEFFIGGIDRVWKQRADGRWEFVRAPYPDTMPRIGLGIRKLTSEWQVFRVSLADQPENNFARVVGGFGWIASWGNNGVEPDESGTAPREVKKFTFEVRNVSYVKEVQP